MIHPAYIYGSRIRLRPANKKDRRPIYEGLACSELTEDLLHREGSLENPAIPWDEFCNDYVEHFFCDSDPENGRCFIIEVEGEGIGQVNYNKIIREKRKTELDIWMFAERHCGQGYGTEALRTLCCYLHKSFGVVEFVVIPYPGNHRAIKAYQKAGFKKVALSQEEAEAEYGRNDEGESFHMIVRIE
jgi:RimJ/RimL family protein N-acetyltransferase